MKKGKQRKVQQAKRRESKGKHGAASAPQTAKSTPLGERDHFSAKGRGGTRVLIEFEPGSCEGKPRKGTLVTEH